MKSVYKSSIFDLLFVIVIVVLVLVPSLRMTVVSTVQRGILNTGLFNAKSQVQNEGENFSYQLVLTDTAGTKINIAELQGKILFINIWATWCPPCMAEMPEIANLYQELSEEVVFLMLSVDKDKEKAKRWIIEEQYPVPVYFPQQFSPELIYDAIPTTWIIDREGKVVFQHTGMAQYNTPDFQKFLLSL